LTRITQFIAGKDERPKTLLNAYMMVGATTARAASANIALPHGGCAACAPGLAGGPEAKQGGPAHKRPSSWIADAHHELCVRVGNAHPLCESVLLLDLLVVQGKAFRFLA
jgi:hypothetical protein